MSIFKKIYMVDISCIHTSAFNYGKSELDVSLSEIVISLIPKVCTRSQVNSEKVDLLMIKLILLYIPNKNGQYFFL